MPLGTWVSSCSPALPSLPIPVAVGYIEFSIRWAGKRRGMLTLRSGAAVRPPSCRSAAASDCAPHADPPRAAGAAARACDTATTRLLHSAALSPPSSASSRWRHTSSASCSRNSAATEAAARSSASGCSGRRAHQAPPPAALEGDAARAGSGPARAAAEERGGGRAGGVLGECRVCSSCAREKTRASRARSSSAKSWSFRVRNERGFRVSGWRRGWCCGGRR